MTRLPAAGEFMTVRKPPVGLVCRATDRERLVGLGILEHDDPSAWSARITGRYRGRGQCLVLALDGCEGEDVVVKKLRHGGLFGAVFGYLQIGAGRPLRELEVVEHLRRSGVPTPEVRFIRSRRLCGPIHHLWIATRNIPSARDLATYLAGGPRSRQVILAAGELVRAMHDAGVVHTDLNLRNLLVVQDGDPFPGHARGPNVWVIDLDRARRLRASGSRDRFANLERLWRSAVKLRLVTHARFPLVAARFLRGYSGGDWRETARIVVRLYGRCAWRHRIAWRLSRLRARSDPSCRQDGESRPAV